MMAMNNEKNICVCPVGLSGGLDNRIRRLLQDPWKILKPYLSEGMTVIDLGCGPGFFAIEMAKMLNGSGKVIAADLQAGMLDKINRKIKGTPLESQIELHRCSATETGLTAKADFILAFWMVHEVPDQESLFKELKSVLKPGGKMLIAEPNLHVSKKSFEDMAERLRIIGYSILEKPKVFFSRTVLLGV
jgi:ubiquinone/menaquinone biosynthesis C-methylase UbiE